MDQEEGRLPLQGVPGPGGLAGSGLHGDDHVPEEAGLPGRPASFRLGEGQDVRRRILTPVAAVERADAPVRDEEASELGLRTAQGA